MTLKWLPATDSGALHVISHLTGVKIVPMVAPGTPIGELHETKTISQMPRRTECYKGSVIVTFHLYQ